MNIRARFLAAAAIAAVTFGTTVASGDASAQGRTIWEGFHFGAHVGGTDVDYGVSQTAPASPLATIRDSGDGVIGGILYGSTWQFDQWVVGTDSDWSWSDADSGTSIAANGLAATAEIDYASSSRVRVGFLPRPNLMVYGTAGIAFASVDVTGTLIAGGSDDENFVGFVAGGGLEATFQNRWFARVEYLHTDYGDEDFNEVGGGRFNVDLDSDTVRGAVGFRFDWSPFDLLNR